MAERVSSVKVDQPILGTTLPHRFTSSAARSVGFASREYRNAQAGNQDSRRLFSARIARTAPDVYVGWRDRDALATKVGYAEEMHRCNTLS